MTLLKKVWMYVEVRQVVHCTVYCTVMYTLRRGMAHCIIRNQFQEFCHIEQVQHWNHWDCRYSSVEISFTLFLLVSGAKSVSKPGAHRFGLCHFHPQYLGPPYSSGIDSCHFNAHFTFLLHSIPPPRFSEKYQPENKENCTNTY